MVKSLIARFSRWVRKTSDKYCTLDMDKEARGLAKCLVRSPITREEKMELLKEAILRNVDECGREEVLNHFRQLSMESDPFQDSEQLFDDSVKKIGIDLPSVDELASTFEGIDREQNRKRAANALRGFGNWPSVGALVSNSRVNKDKNDK